MVDTALESIDFVASSNALAGLDDSFGVLAELLAGTPGGSVPASPLALAAEPGSDGQALSDFLTDLVFTEANYEGDGVFLVRGEDLCQDDFDPVACAQQVDAIEIRVRAVLAGDGVDFTLLIGPDRFEPLALELRPQTAALAADLAEIASSAVHINDVVGDGTPLELPSVLEGVVAASLSVDGPRAVTFAWAIREAIDVRGALGDGGGELALSIAASSPLFSLSVDGVNESADVVLALGRTTLSVPYSLLDDADTSGDQLAVDLAGMTGALAIAEGDTQLTLRDLGLGNGESTVELGGHKLLGVEVPSFGLTADPVAQTVAFDPELALTVDVGFQPLADRGNDVPGFLLDDSYQLTVTDTIQPVAETATFGGGIKVVAGGLSVSAASDGTVIDVPAGSCLVGVDEPSPGSHELLGHLAASACE
jgi:hypothetical protein